MYKLIINGKLDTKVLKSKEELIKELSMLNQLQVYSLNWVKV